MYIVTINYIFILYWSWAMHSCKYCIATNHILLTKWYEFYPIPFRNAKTQWHWVLAFLSEIGLKFRAYETNFHSHAQWSSHKCLMHDISITLFHSEMPKLSGVLAFLSETELKFWAYETKYGPIFIHMHNEIHTNAPLKKKIWKIDSSINNQ